MRSALLAVAVAVTLSAAALEAQGGSECTVTATTSGRWRRAELNCGEPPGSRPRVAVVQPEALRACPLLAGDRVSVTYLYDDPERQPTVHAVVRRGDGGASSGDWCGRGFAPAMFSGPCNAQESPPPEARKPEPGARWTRRTVTTHFWDTNDSSAGHVGLSACSPVRLEPGVHRIYVQESIWTYTWAACTRDPSGYCSEGENETRTYEGGIYVDGAMTALDAVTDVSPLVRGWEGAAVPSAESPVAAGPLLRTDPLRMGGSGVGVPWLVTEGLGMRGEGTGVPWLTTDSIRMAGGS